MKAREKGKALWHRLRDAGNGDLLLFLTTFLLVIVRYLAHGFAYYPQLDDYIQLHNYASSGDYLRFLSEQGLLSARPLAGVFDLYVWSNFYNCLLVAVLLISLMFAASAIFFKRVLERYFTVTPLFCVLYTLVPAAIEGTYWLSASTRIAVGLFFVSLSLVLLERFFADGRAADAIFFVLFQLISFGFYEQVMVFSVAFCGLLFLLNVRTNTRRSFLTFVSFPNLVLYFCLCSLAGASKVYGARMELAWPDNPYYFDVFLPDVLVQIKAVFLDGNAAVFLKGFVRGLTSGAWLPILLSALLCAALAFFFKRKGDTKRPILGMVFGFLLAIAPVSIFFFIANTWLSFRCMVAALPGIALFFDSLTALAFRGRGVAGKQVLTVLFAFVCCAAGISEIGDYKQTHLDDLRFTQALAAHCERYGEKTRIGMLNVEPSYLTDQNFYYHEHIHGVTESAWALSGMMIAEHDGFSHSVTPIPIDEPWRAWNFEQNRPEAFDVILLYERENDSFAELTYACEDGVYAFFDENGVQRAEIVDENGIAKGKLLPNFVGK